MVDSTVQEGSSGSGRVSAAPASAVQEGLLPGPTCYRGGLSTCQSVIRHLVAVLSVGISSRPLFIERCH